MNQTWWAWALWWLPLAGWAQPWDPPALQHFQAEVEADHRHVSLSWALEAGSAGAGFFIVQKSSDGGHWRNLAVFEAADTLTTTGQQWALKDEFKPHFLYYRLVYQNTVGKRHVMVTRRIDPDVVQLRAQSWLDPKTRVLHLSYILDRDKQLLLRVYDHLGHERATHFVPSGRAGVYELELDFSLFARGTYVLVFTQVDRNLDVTYHRVENR